MQYATANGEVGHCVT